MRHPILLLAALLACSPTAAPSAGPSPQVATDPTPPSSRKPPRDADIWVARTDSELEATLQATCEAARAAEQPVLLQFSASWCTDCKRLHTMSTQEPLRGALARWTTLIIDPGRFDRHKDLLRAFQVSRLATWVAVAPEDCRLPAPAWTRLAHGSFEPATGEPVTAADLVAWLDQARTAAEPQ